MMEPRGCKGLLWHMLMVEVVPHYSSSSSSSHWVGLLQELL